MYSVTLASCWCPSKSDTDRNKLWSFYFSCRAVMHQRSSYSPVKSPDTRVGKWALQSRWVKWDLKRLNRSGLPGNTAQQPPAQISTLSLFLHPPLCSHNTSVTVTCVNIILGNCSRTGASDMGSVAIAPMLCMMSSLPLLGIDACEMCIGSKSSQNYPARNAGNPTELCVTPNTPLPHASAVGILLVQLNATSYKHLGLKSKIISSDNSTLAVTQTGEAVTGRGHVSPLNELRMLQDF